MNEHQLLPDSKVCPHFFHLAPTTSSPGRLPRQMWGGLGMKFKSQIKWDLKVIFTSFIAVCVTFTWSFVLCIHFRLFNWLSSAKFKAFSRKIMFIFSLRSSGMMLYWRSLFSQDGWMLASFRFCVFMELDFVSVNNPYISVVVCIKTETECGS